MAVTVIVLPSTANARIYVDVYGHAHSSSTLQVERRVPPTSRELPSIVFVPFDERYREVLIHDAHRIASAATRTSDYHARATVPYEYRAREVFASGAIQDWSPWTA